LKWDFFIAYSSRDGTAADQLSELLRKSGKVFLDRTRLAAGSPWDFGLKSALAKSRIIVVLISRHTEKAWYQLDEIAIAIRLARQKAASHSIVPVLLKGARHSDVPYGLNRLLLLRQADLDLKEIARTLFHELNRMKKRPGTAKLARSVAIMDDIWSDMEPVLQNKQFRIPKEHRIQFVTSGKDLVRRERGGKLVRITPNQFKRKLTPSQYDYVETLEGSMEVNYALWKREYPRRSVSRTSKAKMTKAAAAMAQDFAGILDMLTASGFQLDDHYDSIRQIVKEALGSRKARTVS
jgi:hypothetical protein